MSASVVFDVPLSVITMAIRYCIVRNQCNKLFYPSERDSTVFLRVLYFCGWSVKYSPRSPRSLLQLAMESRRRFNTVTNSSSDFYPRDNRLAVSSFSLLVGFSTAKDQKQKIILIQEKKEKNTAVVSRIWFKKIDISSGKQNSSLMSLWWNEFSEWE